uniref:Uncharacterized protein n=1 Tax=Lotharella globosa TaxID=91324 RepID=A0A7S4DMR3_9EUKA
MPSDMHGVFLCVVCAWGLCCLWLRLLGVFVISSDGELWQILTNKEQSPSTLSSFSSSGGWIRHRHPKDLPLAFMEALAIEPHNHNNGSLFMITKNGQLVEWRIASKNEPTKGLWIVHGIPRSKKGIHKIKKSKKSKGSESFKNTKLPSRAGEGEGLKLMTAPMAIRSKHTVYLYSISNDHNLQEFQLASKPENGKKTQSHWVTHVMPNRLAFVRGVASRNTLWFQQEDGVLVERKILELNPTMRVQPWSKLPKNASKSVSSTVAKPSSSLSPSSSLPSSLPSASSSSSSSSPSSSSSSTMKSPSTRSQSRARSRASRKITSRSSSLASYSFVAYALDDFAHRIRTFHAKNTGYNQVDDTPHDMMKNSNTIPH